MYKLEKKWTTKTTTGILSKGIYSEGETEILVKGNSEPNNKEPFSEVIASNIAKALKLPHISYQLKEASDFPDIKVFGSCTHVSICKKYDLPLYQFCNYMEFKYNSSIRLSNFLTIYQNEGLSINFFIKLMIFDAFIGNQDRHINNIDFIRNLDGTISNAPILDCGASLLYNVSENDLRIYDGSKLGPDKSKPLKDTHREQIHFLERKFGIPKLFTLTSKEDFLDKVFKDSEEVFQHLSEKRINAIKSYLSQRYNVYIHPYTIYKDNLKINSLQW